MTRQVLPPILMIYHPVNRTEHARKVTVEGPELILDCLERDVSCLDMQMLGEAADGSPSCRAILQVKIEPIKRRRGFR
jgi:hypothetical protein